MASPSSSGDLRERTLWSTRDVTTSVRTFLRTESGSAGILVAAIVAALVWANISDHSYETVWQSALSVKIGPWGVSRDLRTWINSGLMAFFFLVVGLEARREFDLGDLRERRRLLLPVVTGLAAMALPALIYVAFNAGRSSAHGWGAAMSTDTALALGALSLLARRVPERVRIFLLTLFVVDDLAALIVIAAFYSTGIHPMPIFVALVAFAILLAALQVGVNKPPVYFVLGVVVWFAMLFSGIDPVVAGLAVGLSASAYSPSRESLEQASGLFRRFREEPTAELAREASVGLVATLSPNARLQRFYHPWTSYLIVPLFGLANAGIVLSGGFLATAYTSAVTLGVLVGYVVGKPVAVLAITVLITRLSKGTLRPAVGWGAVAGVGTIGGAGFTVSFLIATLALRGRQLDEVKLGVLTGAALAAGLMWAVFRVIDAMPKRRRTAALLGRADQLVDLAVEVDPERDHIRGPDGASVTVVEYGDFQCPHCGKAESAVREALLTDADVRYVWRHLPLTDVHPQAQLAAEAAEAAAAQGAFWELHDIMLGRQEALMILDLVRYAAELGLDADRFRDELKHHVHVGRIAQDVESADLSRVSGTPTFFVNGQRHYGAYDAGSLATAIKTARARAILAEAGDQPD